MTGKQHSAINLTSAMAIASLSIPTGNILFVQLGLGVLYSIISSPDTDCDAGFIGWHYFRKAFGRAGAFYWEYLWKPYAKNFTHRGISHMPVVGTLTRLSYVILPSSIFLLPGEIDKAGFMHVVFAQILSVPFVLLLILSIIYLQPTTILMFAIGVVLGDIIHIACDWIGSNILR